MVKHTLKSGKEIEITTSLYLGQVQAYTRVGDKEIEGIPTPIDRIPKDTQRRLNEMGIPSDWYAMGILTLPPAKALEVLAMIEQGQVDANNAPAATSERLRRERQDIIDAIGGYMDEAQHRQDRSFESGDGTGLWAQAGDMQIAEAERYRSMLMAFDEAHPEVIAEIRKEKEESAKRAMWN